MNKGKKCPACGKAHAGKCAEKGGKAARKAR